MAYRTLIAKQTAATTYATSGILRVDQDKHTIAATNLVASEKVTLQISIDNGDTWQDYYEGGSIVELVATQPHITLDSPGLYRAAKTVTASICAVVAASQYYDYQGAL